MKNKKKATGANCGLNQKLNKKLSVVKYNTPFEIEQRILPHAMDVQIKNRQNQNQCLYCLQWFDYLPIAAIYADGTLRGVFVELCESCGDIADALAGKPNDTQRAFWRTIKVNLAKAAAVSAELIDEVKR